MSRRELKLLERQGPRFIGIDTPFIFNTLETKGILKNGCLQLNHFKSSIKTIYLENRKDSIQIIAPDYPKGLMIPDDFLLRFKSGSQTDSFNIRGLKYGIGFLALDIIPDGYKEILVYTTYYIANGDNYELYVLKVDK